MKLDPSIPIHKQIVHQLREEIFCKYHPGDKLPGDNELARLLNVSSLTVREAMSILNEAGLIKRRIGSGTHVASPRIGKEQVIGILIDKDLTHPRFPVHFLPTFEYIRREFSRVGMRVELYTGIAGSNDFPQKITSTNFVADLESGRIAAVVNLIAYPEQQYLDFAATRNIPWVYFGRTGNAPIKITSNTEEILQEVIAAFAQQGKERVALLGWQGFWDTELRNAERRQWFKTALQKQNMTTCEEWIRMDLYPGLSGAGWSQIRTLWTSGKKKPDAIIFLDDFLYVDALPALNRLGIHIPNDLAIGVVTLRAKQLPIQVPTIVADVCPRTLSKAILGHITGALKSGVVTPAQQVVSASIEIFGENEAVSDFSEEQTQLQTEHIL